MNAELATTAPPLGLSHWISHTDTLGLILLGVLLTMSLAAWSILVLKAWEGWRKRQRGARFCASFWNARSLDEVAQQLQVQGADNPFAHLAQCALQARAHHAHHGTTRLAEAGTASEFVTRTLKMALDEETAHAESGLTVLATVGATAPFVGLFGTVWGVYHALVAIGLSGSGALDQVAGPVGEALIMTALGLAVALPAVMGYNLITRTNRVLLAKLDGFAYALHTFVALGQPLGHPARVETAASAAPRAVSAVRAAA
ncbi:MAG: MotA/TolQ/ExbB proton channel family protein [Pseudomonadota bacterium]